jgi:hypothetical protein
VTRGPQLIDQQLLREVSALAEASPRRRKNFNFHQPDGLCSNRSYAPEDSFTSIRVTCAADRPCRAQFSTWATSSGQPCTIASTVPSLRLRTHPVTPSRCASRHMAARYPTPCTRPWTMRCFVIFTLREYYFTRIPGCAPSSGPSRKMPGPSPLAASTMPCDSPKRILRGCRLATITVSRPLSFSGS